jgi:hypothetical protein
MLLVKCKLVQVICGLSPFYVSSYWRNFAVYSDLLEVVDKSLGRNRIMIWCKISGRSPPFIWCNATLGKFADDVGGSVPLATVSVGGNENFVLNKFFRGVVKALMKGWKTARLASFAPVGRCDDFLSGNIENFVSRSSRT